MTLTSTIASNGATSDASASCATPGCTNPLTQRLACPKCIKLGLPPSYFCGQECFAKGYVQHKNIHGTVKQGLSGQKQREAGNVSSWQRSVQPSVLGISCDLDSPDEVRHSLPIWAESFNFTGSLRPHLQSPRLAIPGHIVKPDYATDSAGASDSEEKSRATNNSIRVFGDEELDGGLRYACQMGREVLDLGGRSVRAGVTTDEIDRVVHEACIERECYPSPLNYYQFPKSVCTSVNEIICHGIPDYREIEDGDIVNIDVSAYCRGYHSDLNETFLVGNVDEDGEKVVKTAFDCLAGALPMVKPGTLYRDLGTTIHKVAAKSGCSVVRKYVGHGIGSLFHTAPNVPHYQKNKAKGVMKSGHVFTVEPMINLGSPGVMTWGDKWTESTTDGKRSAQFEHTLLVTESGCKILTARENEPVMMWNRDLLAR